MNANEKEQLSLCIILKWIYRCNKNIYLLFSRKTYKLLRNTELNYTITYVCIHEYIKLNFCMHKCILIHSYLNLEFNLKTRILEPNPIPPTTTTNHTYPAYNFYSLNITDIYNAKNLPAGNRLITYLYIISTYT